MSSVLSIVLLAKELKSRSDKDGDSEKTFFIRLIVAIVVLLVWPTLVLGCMYCPIPTNDLSQSPPPQKRQLSIYVTRKLESIA